jgi:hypothetical protein
MVPRGDLEAVVLAQEALVHRELIILEVALALAQVEVRLVVEEMGVAV